MLSRRSLDGQFPLLFIAHRPGGDHYKDPIYLQSIPTGLELKEGIGEADPMAESYQPAPVLHAGIPTGL